MKRWLFNLLALVSLLLCVAMALAWVRSYFVADTLTSVSPDRSLRRRVALARGRVWYQHINLLPGTRAIIPSRVYIAGNIDDVANQSPLPGIETAGFEVGQYVARTNRPVWHERRVIVPLYALVLLSAALPIAWALAERRAAGRTQKRLKLGLCLQCGYDLRASQDRCPECGSLSRQPLRLN